MTTQELITIGNLSAETGVTVSALRHYDDLGVITPAERVGGKRRFSGDAVGRVNFVRRAQRFGFSLNEIRDILNNSPVEARQLATDKLETLRAQQLELATLIELLQEMMTCGCQVVAECPAMTDRH